MEPMALGSPTHSPSGSPSLHYLPPYLLGEINMPTTPRNENMPPTKTRISNFGSSVAQTSTPEQGIRNGTTMQHQAISNENVYSNLKSPNISYNKHNGPPTEDLFETIRKSESFINNSELGNNLTPFNNSVYGANNAESAQNHSKINYGNSHFVNSWQEDLINEHWVTVFGFPPGIANTVFARLASCGPLIEKHYPTGGNWANVRFSCRAEKERAMALNGRQVSPGIMVGVIDCKEPPQSNTSSISAVTSPDRHAVPARSLCPTALPSTVAPQKSNGLVSKAMEYVFGW